MKVIISAGGTAGHINPAITIADELKRTVKDVQILFVGTPDSMEQRMFTAAGYDFFGMEVHSIAREWGLKFIWWNVKSFFCILKALRTSRRLLREFKPDVVVGCGSFASGPIVYAAAKMRIPTAIHEQNSFPGLANRLLAKSVDKIMITMPESSKNLGYPEKTLLTGNPVRQDIASQDKKQVRAEMGLSDCFVLLSVGGSQGAVPLNNVMPQLIDWAERRSKTALFHSTGERNYDSFVSLLRENGIETEKLKHTKVLPYISNMPEMLAAADLVLCRAGATTLCEVAASGTGALIIPCPDVQNNHQYFNAMSFKNAGAAEVLEQKDLTAQSLIKCVESLADNREKLKLMGINARAAANIDSPKIICRTICSLVKTAAKPQR